MRTTLLCLLLAACGDNTLAGTEDLSFEGDLALGSDLGSMVCDPIAQDCPQNQKCVVSGFGATATTACVMNGTLMEGQACMRSMGMDQCAAGLTCSRAGNVCRKYCESETDCLSGQKCGVGRTGSIIGTCAVPCAPFGNDCGMLNCSSLVTTFGSTGVFFACRMPGSTADFDDCSGGGAACGPNAFCDATEQWCAPLCDDTHPCPPLSGDGGVAINCLSLATGMAGDPGYCAQ